MVVPFSAVEAIERMPPSDNFCTCRFVMFNPNPSFVLLTAMSTSIDCSSLYSFFSLLGGMPIPVSVTSTLTTEL